MSKEKDKWFKVGYIFTITFYTNTIIHIYTIFSNFPFFSLIILHNKIKVTRLKIVFKEFNFGKFGKENKRRNRTSLPLCLQNEFHKILSV